MKKKIFSTLLLVAFALASTSMFVSCKDYDDDINKNAADISALRAELQKQLADCQAKCQAEHSKFLTEHQSLEGYAKLSDIPSLEGYATLAALQAELANYVKASEIQDALDYIKALQEKGITADGLAELGVKVAAIDEALLKLLKVDSIDKAAAAAENLRAQIDALNLYGEALKKENIDPDKLVELLNKIKDIKTDVEKSPADNLTADEVKTLKDLIAKADELINQQAGPDINIIQYLIDKTLASLVLMPSDYVAGLATIEVPALYYQPVIYAKGEGKDEAYYYIDKNGKKLDGLDWRFDDGANAPSATVPTWDEGFGYSNEFSGYDYRGEGYNPVGPDGEGTMLPIFRSVVEKYKALKTAQLVPAAIAKYHVNPTTVKLDDYKLSFWTNTAVVTDEIESRNSGYLNSMANNFAAPVKENGADYAVSGGILEVPFKINNWENYVEDLVYYFDGVAINQKTKSKAGIVRDSVNFIALQMTKGDTATITSDYAAVVPALIHINAIADNGPENPVLDCQMEKTYEGLWYTKQTEDAGHMFKYAAQAIDKDFTHSIPYNKTLDILPFVETHFTYIGIKSAWASYDQRMDAETFKKLGLKYVFSVVDYEDGNHATGESRHITIDAKENAGADFGYDEVILTPRSVKYDKDGKSYSTILDKVATREAIDREPLIKVEIVDPNNNVLEVGYIKLLITDNYMVEPVELTVDDDYWMNCTDKGGLKWSQIEESVLSQLGENGYTKKQFEDEYEIDLKDAQYAQRFINVGGQWKVDPSPLGDVEYTKITINDPKDKQTNVILWAIGDNYAEIAKAITGTGTADAARAALLASKGDGTDPHKLTTTVRFVKKGIDEKYKDMSAIYVTINIPAPQVHFAYGTVEKKDLSHWYRLNSYKNGSEKEGTAIDILENVPTPAENGQKNLGVGCPNSIEFERPLYENFLNGIVSVNMNGKEKNFSKYDYTNNKNISFEFTLPVEGVNAEFSHVNGTWEVYGYSGAKYTLHLSADKKQILDQHGAGDVIAEIVDKDGQPYIRMVDNDCANDILNHSGRYDDFGNDKAKEGSSTPFYLENGTNKESFTAYLLIKTNDECYELLLDNRYFNAKFLRPINVWGKSYNWNDAFNAVQVLNPTELLVAKDWRDYDIKLDVDWNDGNNTAYTFKEGEIGWDYYNIYEVSVKYDEIFTDHAKELQDRKDIEAALANKETIPSIIKNFTLNRVSEIPALKDPYLKVKAVDNSLKTYNSAGKLIGTKAPQTVLEYTNNGGNVQDFHLFVPISVYYGWGHKAGNTFKVWATINVKKTTGTDSQEAKKN
ncbi:MAG: hypothetical protein J6T43_00725 [Prevotella sp.]|nr:hypothetical protein [Prevotella sp.]MBP5356396.1 hypothetical protein [Prevotella sp.]